MLKVANNREIWEQAGWSDYFSNAKRALAPWLVNRPDLIGDKVLDVGSPSFSLYLSGIRPKKVIAIDWTGQTEIKSDALMHIKADIYRLLEDHSRDFIMSRRRARKFLSSEGCPSIDTATFCSILNYVPYKKVINRGLAFVRPGGTIVVLNKPGMTLGTRNHLLDPEGVKSNLELYDYCIDDLMLKPLLLLGMGVTANQEWGQVSIRDCPPDALTFMAFGKPKFDPVRRGT